MSQQDAEIAELKIALDDARGGKYALNCRKCGRVVWSDSKDAAIMACNSCLHDEKDAEIAWLTAERDALKAELDAAREALHLFRDRAESFLALVRGECGSHIFEDDHNLTKLEDSIENATRDKTEVKQLHATPLQIQEAVARATENSKDWAVWKDPKPATESGPELETKGLANENL